MAPARPATSSAPGRLGLVAAPERRPPSRGESRRAALLAALEELLADTAFDDIGVEDITARAGVTRPAFYFYFQSKAAAVAALIQSVFATMTAATGAFFERDDGTPRERLRESLTQGAAAWHGHGTLIRALYDAAGVDRDIRAVLDQWLDAFVELTAQRIEEERAAGSAPDGIDARALAGVLVGMNERAFVRDLYANASAGRIEVTIEALVDVWASALYRDVP